MGHIEPTEEQLKALSSDPQDGSIVMVNLLCGLPQRGPQGFLYGPDKSLTDITEVIYAEELGPRGVGGFS